MLPIYPICQIKRETIKISSLILLLGIFFWGCRFENNSKTENEPVVKINFESNMSDKGNYLDILKACLLYTSPSPRDLSTSRMPSSA